MEKRSQVRVETHAKVQVTVLNAEPLIVPAEVTNISGTGMRLLTDRAIAVGAPLAVEWNDCLLLGDVCYCQPANGGYAIGLQLEHSLMHTSELARFASSLIGEPESATKDSEQQQTARVRKPPTP